MEQCFDRVCMPHRAPASNHTPVSHSVRQNEHKSESHGVERCDITDRVTFPSRTLKTVQSAYAVSLSFGRAGRRGCIAGPISMRWRDIHQVVQDGTTPTVCATWHGCSWSPVGQPEVHGCVELGSLALLLGPCGRHSSAHLVDFQNAEPCLVCSLKRISVKNPLVWSESSVVSDGQFSYCDFGARLHSGVVALPFAPRSGSILPVLLS